MEGTQVEIRLMSRQSATRVCLHLIERAISFCWNYSGGLVASRIVIEDPTEAQLEHLTYFYKVAVEPRGEQLPARKKPTRVITFEEA